MTMVVTAPLAVATVVVHAQAEMHRPDVRAEYVSGRGGRAEKTHGEDSGDQQFHGGLQASS
jgi:hypothetical protein